MKRTFLLTLYARREPSADSVLLKYAPQAKRFDVVFYADHKATQPKGRFMWFSAGNLRPTHKTVMLNCYRWRMVWLPKVQAQAVLS